MMAATFAKEPWEMPVFNRRAALPVLFLAAGYALRALVGVVPAEPDAGLAPGIDVEQQSVDPVLVPARHATDPAAWREHQELVRHQPIVMR